MSTPAPNITGKPAPPPSTPNNPNVPVPPGTIAAPPPPSRVKGFGYVNTGSPTIITTNGQSIPNPSLNPSGASGTSNGLGQGGTQEQSTLGLLKPGQTSGLDVASNLGVVAMPSGLTIGRQIALTNALIGEQYGNPTVKAQAANTISTAGLSVTRNPDSTITVTDTLSAFLAPFTGGNNIGSGSGIGQVSVAGGGVNTPQSIGKNEGQVALGFTPVTGNSLGAEQQKAINNLSISGVNPTQYLGISGNPNAEEFGGLPQFQMPSTQQILATSQAATGVSKVASSVNSKGLTPLSASILANGFVPTAVSKPVTPINISSSTLAESDALRNSLGLSTLESIIPINLVKGTQSLPTFEQQEQMFTSNLISNAKESGASYITLSEGGKVLETIPIKSASSVIPSILKSNIGKELSFSYTPNRLSTIGSGLSFILANPSSIPKSIGTFVSSHVTVLGVGVSLYNEFSALEQNAVEQFTQIPRGIMETFQGKVSPQGLLGLPGPTPPTPVQITTGPSVLGFDIPTITFDVGLAVLGMETTPLISKGVSFASNRLSASLLNPSLEATNELMPFSLKPAINITPKSIPTEVNPSEVTLEASSTARTLPTYAALNPMRIKVATNVFELDTATPPRGSSSIQFSATNSALENLKPEIQSNLSRIQSNLLTPSNTKTSSVLEVSNNPVSPDFFYSPSKNPKAISLGGVTPNELLASGVSPLSTSTTTGTSTSGGSGLTGGGTNKKTPSGPLSSSFPSPNILGNVVIWGGVEVTSGETYLGSNSFADIDRLQIPRSKVVEETKPILNNELYNNKGIKLTKLFGESKAIGVLGKSEPIKIIEPRLPEDLNPLGRRGQPAVKTNYTKDLSQLARSEYVEAGRIKPESEVFSSRGQPLETLFGNIKSLGALRKVEVVKALEPTPPEVSNPLGHRGKPAIKTNYPPEFNPSRASFVESSRIFFDIKGLGALRKIEPVKNNLVQEEKGFKNELPLKRLGGKNNQRKVDIEKILEEEEGTPNIGEPKSFTDEIKTNPNLESFKPTTAETSISTPDVNRFIPNSKDFIKIKNTKDYGIDLGPPNPNGKLSTGGGSRFTETSINVGIGIGRLIPTGKGEGGLSFKSPPSPPSKPSEDIPKELKGNTNQVQILKEQEEIIEKPKQRFKEYPIPLGEGKGRTIKKENQKLRTGFASIQITGNKKQKKRTGAALTISGSALLTELNVKPAQASKLGHQQPQTFKQNQQFDQLEELSTIQTPKQSLQHAQPEAFKTSTPQLEVPDLNLPQLPKQIQAEALSPDLELLVKNDNTPEAPPFLLFDEKKRFPKSKKSKKELADFIGNSSESNIEGIYNRSEIKYGQKTINRLVSQDMARTKKNYNLKISGKETEYKTYHGDLFKDKHSPRKFKNSSGFKVEGFKESKPNKSYRKKLGL